MSDSHQVPVNPSHKFYLPLSRSVTCSQQSDQRNHLIGSDMLSKEERPFYTRETVLTIPIYFPLGKQEILSTLVAELRKFLIVSNAIYFCWSIVAMSLALIRFIIVTTSVYSLLLIGNLFVSASLSTFLVLIWPSKAISYLIRLFVLMFFIDIVAFLFFAIHYTTSIVCSGSQPSWCIAGWLNDFTLIFVLVFLIVSLHTVINLIVTLNMNHRILSEKCTSDV